MVLLKVKSDNKLEKLKEIPFKKEKEIQTLIELNLKEIFGLEFVASEFALENLRIDTLAFDNETKSFVIIEYKKDKNFSLVDQGLAYLSLLFDRKSDFILKYNECKNKNLRKEDVDWSQSKIVFISPQFTEYQKRTSIFKDLPLELWEISRYENDIILINKINLNKTSESIAKLSSINSKIQKISREIKIYTEEDHFKNIPDDIMETYEELKNRILNLGKDIEIKPRKRYIGFVANTNFVDVHLQKSQIKIWINLRKGELEDPKNLARDVSNVGHWGNGDYEIIIKPDSDLDYIMYLIKQSYDKNRS